MAYEGKEICYLRLSFARLFFSQIRSIRAEEDTPATIKIGVLARRGVEECLKEWSPTAQYLTERLPGIAFKIVNMQEGSSTSYGLSTRLYPETPEGSDSTALVDEQADSLQVGKAG